MAADHGAAGLDWRSRVLLRGGDRGILIRPWPALGQDCPCRGLTPSSFVLRCVLLPLLSGALAAVVLDRGDFRRFWRRFAAFGVRRWCFWSRCWLHVSPENPEKLAGAVMCLLMTLLLVTLVVKDQALSPAADALPPSAGIGEISYGIYLYHLIGLHIANELVIRSRTVRGRRADAVTTLIYLPVSILIMPKSAFAPRAVFLSLKRHHPRQPAAARPSAVAWQNPPEPLPRQAHRYIAPVRIRDGARAPSDRVGPQPRPFRAIRRLQKDWRSQPPGRKPCKGKTDICALKTMEEFEALLNEKASASTTRTKVRSSKSKVIAIEAGRAIIDVGYRWKAASI